MLEAETTLRIAPDHPCLEGHFPGHPIVPAAVLLDLAAELLRSRTGAVGRLGVAHAKFLLPVLPDQPVRLHLRIGDGRAAFRIESPRGLAAQGELRFVGGMAASAAN